MAVTDEQVELLVAALDQVGEPDAPTIGEVFTELTKESVTGLITLAGQLTGQDEQLAAAGAGASRAAGQGRGRARRCSGRV